MSLRACDLIVAEDVVVDDDSRFDERYLFFRWLQYQLGLVVMLEATSPESWLGNGLQRILFYKEINQFDDISSMGQAKIISHVARDANLRFLHSCLKLINIKQFIDILSMIASEFERKYLQGMYHYLYVYIIFYRILFMCLM